MCAQRRLRSAWASAQSGLGICPVPSAFAVRMKKVWVLSYPLSASEDSDQTRWMARLIWAFAGCTVILLVLSWGGSYLNLTEVSYSSIWAAAWQNLQDDMCAQRRLGSAWASTQSVRSLGSQGFFMRTVKTADADAQADPSLHWTHSFVVWCLIYWTNSKDSGRTVGMCKLARAFTVCLRLNSFSWAISKVPPVIRWTASSEFSTYRICEQHRFRRACASTQSHQNLRCSLIQATSQEEPSDRKPDP